MTNSNQFFMFGINPHIMTLDTKTITAIAAFEVALLSSSFKYDSQVDIMNNVFMYNTKDETGEKVTLASCDNHHVLLAAVPPI